MREPTTAEALARALSYVVFVNSDGLTLGHFMDLVRAYGDARVREAEARTMSGQATGG